MKSFDSLILDRINSDYNGSIPKFAKKYYADSHNTKIRSIRKYIDCQQVPSYRNAKEILVNLGYSFTDEMIMQSLDLMQDKRLMAIIDYKELTVIRDGVIKTKHFLKGQNLNPLDKEQMVKRRIIMTTKSGTQNEYLRRLVELDCNNEILEVYKKEEDK